MPGGSVIDLVRIFRRGQERTGKDGKAILDFADGR